MKTKSFIVDGVYTPRASVKKGVSAYSEIHPQNLVAACFESLRERQPAVFGQIDSIYLGCVSQVGDQGANLARNAGLLAGIDYAVSATTLNMCCGSGLQSVNIANALTSSGSSALVLAGGVESMSRLKIGSDGGGMDGNNTSLQKHLQQVPQGISADFIATTEGITREELDAYSLRSHQKAISALEKKAFENSYAHLRNSNGEIVLGREDHPRKDTTIAALSALKPAFAGLSEQLKGSGVIAHGQAIPKVDNFHTAGNSSGIADGAAAILIANDKYLENTSFKPRARILAIEALGSDPISMLTGPSACCSAALKSSGLSAGDIDLWEINEAFAVVPIQTIRNLKLDESKVNIYGGAIALGHPLGATGSILLVSMLNALERENLSLGCIVLCVAGGQSIACVIERC